LIVRLRFLVLGHTLGQSVCVVPVSNLLSASESLEAAGSPLEQKAPWSLSLLQWNWGDFATR